MCAESPASGARFVGRAHGMQDSNLEDKTLTVSVKDAFRISFHHFLSKNNNMTEKIK
jgi:hypothetical protein